MRPISGEGLVIVDCESCHTRFRLDDARIPASGARVRCSRCKTAFVVHRPSASVNDVVEEVVAESTQPGATNVPEATADLFESSGRVIGETQPASAGSPEGQAGGDEQWEFNEAPPVARSPEVAPLPARSAPRTRSVPRSPAPAAAESRDEDVLPSLGAPADWDLLGPSTERIAEDISFKPTRAAVSATPVDQARTPEPLAAGSVDSALREANGAAEAPQREPAPSSWREALASVVDFVVVGSGWITASGLCLIGLGLAVQPHAWSPDPGASQVMPALLGSAEHEVSLFHVENGVAGNLIVVRGQLPPSNGAGPPTRLRASWLDASGSPIAGAGAVAGPPLAKRKLREHSLARLQADHEAHALEVTAGGPYEVVFSALPAAATRISLQREPVAPLVVESAASQEAGAEQGATQPSEESGATASSLPSAPLSSE